MSDMEEHLLLKQEFERSFYRWVGAISLFMTVGVTISESIEKKESLFIFLVQTVLLVVISIGCLIRSQNKE